MDIKTLESLGLNVAELGERIVDQAVGALLNATGFNPDTEEETRYETRFKREIESRIQKTVDSKIAALAEEHLLPRIGEMIETANLQKTNTYGEPKGPPMTFIEYIAACAETYMFDDVDYHGKSKAELAAKGNSTYDFRSAGPRLTVLMKSYIQDTLDKAAKAAVSDVNKVIAANIEKAAKDAIKNASSAIKVAVTV